MDKERWMKLIFTKEKHRTAFLSVLKEEADTVLNIEQICITKLFSDS